MFGCLDGFDCVTGFGEVFCVLFDCIGLNCLFWVGVLLCFEWVVGCVVCFVLLFVVGFVGCLDFV